MKLLLWFLVGFTLALLLILVGCAYTKKADCTYERTEKVSCDSAGKKEVTIDLESGKL